ncbi:hypothetical protein DQW77_04395 [Roseovarius sp. TE539]|nr:hypothetical protein DQW77_04395 [Roseovarius sp. TE539]
MNCGSPNERYCLFFNSDNGAFEYFYCERGEKFDFTSFSDEAEACEYFLQILRKSTTARSFT